jgi:hypothetical protein
VTPLELSLLLQRMAATRWEVLDELRRQGLQLPRVQRELAALSEAARFFYAQHRSDQALGVDQLHAAISAFPLVHRWLVVPADELEQILARLAAVEVDHDEPDLDLIAAVQGFRRPLHLGGHAARTMGAPR